MIKEKMKQLVGKSIKAYNNEYSKPKIDELKFKEQYQGRIIDCMVGEVDDNYIETPLTDENVVKLEYSKEGVVKIPSIKGKTILVDSEGNETDTPGEGCRLVSVGEEEDNKLIILSKNRNIFNSEEFYNDWKSKESNYIYKEKVDGEDVFKIMDGSSLWDKDRGYKVRVEKGKSYKLSMKVKTIAGTTNNVILVRNGTKNVGGFHVWEEDYFYERYGIFVAEEDYIYICSGYNRHIYFYIKDIQLTQQPYCDTFIPHQSHKTEILLNEPLRSIPSGVCDEIVGNQTIRRVGRIILDGTENWNVHPYEKEGFLNVWVDPFKKPENMIIFGSTNCERYLKCNILNIKNNRDLFEELISIHYQPTVKWCYISVSKERMSDINEFKKWLSENHIEILYELAEPIIEELPNSITLQGFDDTTMYIENSITPIVQYGYNALIPYKQELLNQKEEVETNTLDIEQNIIPYLMDMEFNLMLMEDE